MAVVNLLLKGLKLATSIAASSGDGVAEKHRARSAILTSVISGIGIFAIIFFISIRLFLAELGVYTPENTNMFFTLNEFLGWVLSGLLGLGGTAGFLGSKRLLNQTREEFEKHNKEIKEQKERAQKENEVYKSLPNGKNTYRLLIQRDYKKKYTISQLSIQIQVENQWLMSYPNFCFIFELPRYHGGKENQVGKTCVLEGIYLGSYAEKSASGKFCEFGLYYLNDVPGRSGILIHRGWGGSNPAKYIQGCLMPCFGLDEKERLINSEKAMKELVDILGKQEVIIKITS